MSGTGNRLPLDPENGPGHRRSGADPGPLHTVDRHGQTFLHGRIIEEDDPLSPPWEACQVCGAANHWTEDHVRPAAPEPPREPSATEPAGLPQRKEKPVDQYIEKVTKPERGDVFEGISYPVSLRATPARDADGLTADWREVMWSADLAIEEGVSLTASAGTPEAALDKLQDVIANHTRPYPEDSDG